MWVCGQVVERERIVGGAIKKKIESKATETEYGTVNTLKKRRYRARSK